MGIFVPFAGLEKMTIFLLNLPRMPGRAGSKASDKPSISLQKVYNMLDVTDYMPHRPEESGKKCLKYLNMLEGRQAAYEEISELEGINEEKCEVTIFGFPIQFYLFQRGFSEL